MFTLLEKIVQIEDLKLPEFLHQIQNLATLDLKKATKGYTFFFGLDEEGKLFSSKYSIEDKFYSTLRYQKEPDNNAFIGAHKFVFKYKAKIEKILKPNEFVECKVQFFENTFDKDNNLILMKGDHLSELQELLSRRTLINSQQTFSLDGRNTNTVERPSYWNCKEPKELDKLDLSGVKAELEKLKDFLSKPSDIDEKFTNYEMVQLNLIKIPVDKRPLYKTEREKINDFILTNFKLPIKRELIDKNKELDIVGDEDTIEIKDNSLLKNNFFLQPKHELSGIIRTSDPDAKLELRGGLFGEVMQRIATLFGIPEMANIQSAQKVFREIKGERPEDTARTFAESLAKRDFYSIKTKLIAVFTNLQKDIEEKRDAFKHDVGDYELKISDDVVLKYEKEDIQNNLNAFGEVSDEVFEILHKLKISTTIPELVMIVFRRALELVHDEIVKESLSINTQSLSTEQICYAYMANYLCALLLLRAKDRKTSTLMKDVRYSLKKFSPHASRLNHWGFLLFNSNYNKESSKLLNSHTYKDLSKTAGRLINKRVQFVHDSISRAQNLIQDWSIHEESAKLFLMRLETYETGIKDSIEVITKWEDANLSDKTIAINKLFFYLQRHDSASPLFNRMRWLANSILINTQDTKNKEGILEMKKSLIQMLDEDDVGATPAPAGAGGAQTMVGSTTAGSIGSVPTRMFKNKMIVRKIRNFEKKSKFKRPQDLAVKGADVDPTNNFESIKAVLDTKSCIIEWNDDDCFKKDYKGYDYVRKEYNLALEVTEAKTTWPSVKMIGSKDNIKNFLSEQYGMSIQKIKELIGE